MDKKEKTNH